MRLEVLALVAALTLAGCASNAGPDGAAGTQGAVTEEGVMDDPTGGAMPGLAAFPTELVDVTLWENGTFSAEQHTCLRDEIPCFSATEPTGLVQIDLSSYVPMGVPSRVIGEVNAELTQGDLDLWIDVPGESQFRTGMWDSPFGGYTRFEAGIVRTMSDPIVVNLMYDTFEPAQSFDYVLSIRIVSVPHHLQNGIPTALELPADATIEVTPMGDKRTGAGLELPFALMVYAPDDTFLGSFALSDATTSVKLPEGSPAGEYVILLSQGGRDAVVVVPGGNATLRATDQAFVFSDARQGDAPGHAAWTFDHARVPILAGVFFPSPALSQNVEIALDGPNGALLGQAFEGNWATIVPPAGPGLTNSFGMDSGYGAPGLGAGTYSADVRFEQAIGNEPLEAFDFAAFYVR